MDLKTAFLILTQIKESYNIIGEKFSQSRRYIWPDLMFMLDYIKNGDHILDVGCGNGRLAEFLLEKRSVEYVGVDTSEVLLSEARKKYRIKDLRDKIDFEICDALELYNKFKKESFNVVLAVAILNHFPIRKLQLKVLENIYQVLKPGGFLFITNWNLWRLSLRQKSVWKCLRERLRYSNAEWKRLVGIEKNVLRLRDCFTMWKSGSVESFLYYYAFKRSELRHLLEEIGFSIEQNFYSDKGKKSNLFFGRNIVTIAKK